VTITLHDYQTARADGGPLPIPARSALQLARYRKAEPDWHGLEPTGEDPGSSKPVASGIVDGFTVTVALVVDEYPMVDWAGTFTPARDRYGEREARPDPSAIIWNNGGYWRLERGEHWYTPTESLVEIMDYYRKAGASRSVAREYALADIRRRADQDAEEIENGGYIVDVLASRAGVELGRASLAGYTVGKDWERDLASDFADLLWEAIGEARTTLAELCVPA